MIVFNDQLTIASIPRHFWGSYVPFHPVSQFMIIKRTLATLHYANVKCILFVLLTGGEGKTLLIFVNVQKNPSNSFLTIFDVKRMISFFVLALDPY